MSTEWQASNPIPPRSGSVLVLTTTTTAAATTMPTEWVKGRFVSMYSGADTYVLFSSTSGITATSGVGGYSTTNGVAGILPAGLPQLYRLDGSDTWLHHVSSTTATIRICLASP